MTPSRAPGTPPPSWLPPEPSWPLEPHRHAAAAPRWLWSIAVVVVALWWPVHSYWQSDDFIALHYASDAARAFGDFAHNQYGLAGLVWFYRPLITLSFAFDAAVAGAEPFLAHLGNALAHGLSAVLLAFLVHRFLGGRAAFAAALVWGAHPAHAGSILWAAGRVDSHTTVWILLSLCCLLRWRDGRSRTRIWSLLALVLGLCSKELAVVTAPLGALLCFGLADRRRAFAAWRATWPHFAVLALYLAGRQVMFGRVLGGYEGQTLQILPSLAGLGRFTLNVLNPLHDQGPLLLANGLPPALAYAGFVPVLLGAGALLMRGRAQLLLGLLAGYLICALPVLQFWNASDDPRNLRYFYLPATCIAAVIGAGGLATGLLALAVFALPWLDVRRHYVDWFDDARRVHAQLADDARSLPPGLLFVADLPRQDASGLVIGFHLGVDRLLATPFGPGQQRVMALRPLVQRNDAFTVPYGDVHGLPEGTTLAFPGRGILARLEPWQRPDVGARIEGPTHLGSAVLWDLYRDRTRSDLVMRQAAPFYRITVFTAGGYVATLLPNEAPAGATEGRVALTSWLKGRCAATGDDAFVTLALAVPATLDLSTRFPMLVEAGTMEPPVAGAPAVFRATHASRELLWITLDRDFAELVAGRVAAPDR